MEHHDHPSIAEQAAAALAFRDAEEMLAHHHWADAHVRLLDATAYLDDPAVKAELVTAAAHVAVAGRSPHAAKTAALAAVGMSEEADGTPSTDALLQLGYALDDCDEPGEALSVYAKVRERFETEGDAFGLVHVDMNIALALRGRGDHDDALDLLLDVCERAHVLGDGSTSRSARHNLVASFQTADRHEEALATAESVLQDQHEHGTDREITDATYHLGNALLGVDRTEDARIAYITAMEAYRRLNLPTEVADCLDVLGAIARIDGVFTFAVSLHNRAIETYSNAGLRSEEATARLQLANTLLRLGDPAGAIVEARRATETHPESMDGRVVEAAACDALGRETDAEELRAGYRARWGERWLARGIEWASRK